MSTSGLSGPLPCNFVLPATDTHACTHAPSLRVGLPLVVVLQVIKSTTYMYDAKMADIWSCGVALYVMLFGRYPFDVASHDVRGGRGGAGGVRGLSDA